jgi:secreted trypsin-like serine protease
MRHWVTLVFIVYLLEITGVHTQDDPGPETEAETPESVFKNEPRIVGGTSAIMGQFPYQVLIYITTAEGRHLCGGAIIGAQNVLTAAHCVAGISADKLEVWAGNIKRLRSRDRWLISSVSEVHVHEDYLDDKIYNDVALLKLQERYPLDGQVTASVKLRDTEVSAGEMCTVSGWGTTSEGGSIASTLQYVRVPIVDRDTCSGMMRRRIFDGEICAGFSTGGKDACQGDSGGPLVCDGYLTGVVAWGEGCARENKPGVYAYVVWYKDWIEKRASSPDTDEQPSPISEPPPGDNDSDERDIIDNEQNNKGAINGFTNAVVVLSFVPVLTYLFI